MSGERDPRASRLEDDPFDRTQSPGSHTRARDDGNWRSHTSELFSLTTAKVGSLSSEYLGKSHNPAESTFTRAQSGIFLKLRLSILLKRPLPSRSRSPS